MDQRDFDLTEYKIISVLIGLIRACDSNPKTENTDRLVIKALAFPLFCVSDVCTSDDIIAEIRAEKNIISPGCATCAAPCGNTSDYDMSNVFDASNEIRNTKLSVLSELQTAAAYIYQNEISLSENDIELFYKALAYFSYDMEKEAYISLLEEIQELKRKLGETDI